MGHLQENGFDVEVIEVADIVKHQEDHGIPMNMRGCHSSVVGEYMIEEHARVPVEVEYASEFRYYDPIIDQDTAVLSITQSGETADTLAAISEAKKQGATTFAICNVIESSIARECLDSGGCDDVPQ